MFAKVIMYYMLSSPLETSILKDRYIFIENALQSIYIGVSISDQSVQNVTNNGDSIFRR
jgi:hypothetical protein